MKQGPGTVKASIISVWVLDYYEVTYPPPAPRKSENIPLPIVIDEGCRQIGQLPQHYPDDPPRELDIYYKEGEVGLPSKILIDVYNPAVSGDYYF